MNKNVIYAVSFIHNGERVVVKPTRYGKFKVPVSQVENGVLRTRMRALSAMEIINHDIIKNCDPTFYLTESGSDRLRVYPGGDPTYLPAQSEGIATKHDQANKVSYPKIKKKNIDTPSSNGYNSYEQASLDLYGWWPGDEYGDGTD